MPEDELDFISLFFISREPFPSALPMPATASPSTCTVMSESDITVSHAVLRQPTAEPHGALSNRLRVEFLIFILDGVLPSSAERADKERCAVRFYIGISAKRADSECVIARTAYIYRSVAGFYATASVTGACTDTILAG